MQRFLVCLGFSSLPSSSIMTHHHHHIPSVSSHHHHHHHHSHTHSSSHNHHHHHHHDHNRNHDSVIFIPTATTSNSSSSSTRNTARSKETNMKKPLLHDSQKQEKEDSNSNDYATSSSLLIYLYVGHFLSRWGARMWEFSVGLYMINIWPESLLVTAIYGAVEAASTSLLGPIIGRLVDRLSYVQVLRLWLFIQNVSFIVAGGTVTALLIYPGLRITHFPVFISLIIITNISGAVGVLATLAGTLLVEREWVVVISNGQPPEALTQMNSVIRRIDLVCKLFAPVVSGFIISFISLKDSAVTFTLWNIVSVLIIYWLLSSVYNGIPALTENNQKRNARFPPNDSIESPPSLQETESLLPHKGTDSAVRENDWKDHIIERFSKIPYVQAWTVYLQQDVVLPGIALALLFFTVLSFGTLMTATLQWEGVPAYVIGIMRGISAMIGIAATLLYPILHSRLSTLRTGLWSIWMQWTFLLVCVASVWVRNSHISAWLLMGGVAASRLGLWMFDLSVMQQMQDHVRESDRCVVGGVQNSIQSMMDLLTCIMGIFISNPKDFWKLSVLSFSSVTLAAILYCFHIYRVRKHLFHFEKLVAVIPWSIRQS